MHNYPMFQFIYEKKKIISRVRISNIKLLITTILYVNFKIDEIIYDEWAIYTAWNTQRVC